MRTERQQTLSPGRNNNLNAIRLFAALWVMMGHMGQILGLWAPTLGSNAVHTLGVEALFLISGYVNALSWKRDGHYGRFVLRRFLRLWPPFAVMILLMAFVAGPLLSDLGRDGYYQSWWNVYLQNLRFYIIYSQPGVFTSNPIANVTNGSLWMLPAEMALYLIIPLQLWIYSLIEKRGRKSFSFAAGFTILVCALCLWMDTKPELNLIFYATDWIAAFRLMVFFQIGLLCSYDEARRWLNPQGTIIAMTLLMLCQSGSETIQFAGTMLAWSYIVMSLGLAEHPVFARVGTRVELSYGIYLYGFFFQQLVAQWKMRTGYGGGMIPCFLISLGMTAAAAFLNSVLVEKPIQKASSWLTRKWKEADLRRC